MLSLGDSIPDEVRSFVVQIKNVVLEFETLAGSWARQILRQGFVAEMARVEQSVRAGLPLQVDKFIRAAEVVQKYSGPEGPSSIVSGKSFADVGTSGVAAGGRFSPGPSDAFKGFFRFV